ncbi:hypothetical protein B0T16DRAFT_387773 [Cercophora newfieldiana]|uniref:Uncharacterized protein n=1 Tax=Cercophora newfieldiana TaxID=92897 RepID=A0AA40CVU9_9PEZI|nr:hypothetical protein B0T16DRAFT_387773 [Cercophora newfieldiana]
MRPIKFDMATPEYLKDRLFIIDPQFVTIHYMEKLLARNGNGACITTEKGSVLPTELWIQIIKHLINDAIRPGRHGQRLLAKATLIYESPSTTTDPGMKLLRCVPHEYDLPPSKKIVAGVLQNIENIAYFNDYLDCATAQKIAEIRAEQSKALKGSYAKDNEEIEPSDCLHPPWPDLLPVELPNMRKVSGPDSATYYISLREHKGGSLPEGIFCQIRTQDVIAWVEGGFCWHCNGERLMKCDRRLLKRLEYLFPFSKWSWVNSSGTKKYICPLCMGPPPGADIGRPMDDDSMEWTSLLDDYSKKLHAWIMKLFLEGRLIEMGYGTRLVDGDG